jgi:hypothetical protein
MRINAFLNIPDPEASNIHIAELNWGELLPHDVPVEETSLILAADCVYFEVCRPSCLSLLRLTLYSQPSPFS